MVATNNQIDLNLLSDADLQAMYNAVVAKANSEAKVVAVKTNNYQSLLERMKNIPIVAKQETATVEAKSFEENVAKNIGDINSVIYPYYFTQNQKVVLQPADTKSVTITINNEAPFDLIRIVKSVFLVTDFGLPTETWSYIDPENISEGAPGLRFTMKDTSTGKDYFDKVIELDHVGNSRFPMKFPTPTLLMPNTNTEIVYSNTHASNIYVPIISFLGMRIRIDKASDMLSLVTEG